MATSEARHLQAEETKVRSGTVSPWKARADFAPAGPARRSREWLAVERELEARFYEVIAERLPPILEAHGALRTSRLVADDKKGPAGSPIAAA